MRRLIVVLCVALSGGAALAACSSSSRIPTTKLGDGAGNVITVPADIVSGLRNQCTRGQEQVRLDLREGDAHLRPVFDCALLRDNPSGAEAELIDLVRDRHDAARRADATNTVAAEFGVHSYDRSMLIWTIGTGRDGCDRITDVPFHREELDTASRYEHESAVHWTQVEAARFVGTCPAQLGAFLDSVAAAGQPEAAAAVRTKLFGLGVLPGTRN